MSDVIQIISKFPAEWARIGLLILGVYFIFMAVERIVSNPRMYRQRKEKILDMVALAATVQMTDLPLRAAIQERIDAHVFEEVFGIRAGVTMREALVKLPKSEDSTVSWEILRRIQKFLGIKDGVLVIQFMVIDRIQYVVNWVTALGMTVTGCFLAYAMLTTKEPILPLLPTLVPMVFVIIVMIFIPLKQAGTFGRAWRLREHLEKTRIPATPGPVSKTEPS